MHFFFFFYYSDGKILSLEPLQYVFVMNLSFAQNTFMYV